MRHLPARALTFIAAIAIASLPGSTTDAVLLHSGSTGLSHLDSGDLLVVPPGTPGPLPAKAIGAVPVAFRPSGTSVAPKSRRKTSRVEVFQVGSNALEPTMGIDSEGRVFYLAGMAGDEWPIFPSQTLRSADNGKTWADVTPEAPQDHPTTEDPYLYVDEDTGRVFSSDFLLPCAEISHSDDAGETWISTVSACDLMDHQTIFAGDPVTSEPIGYPNVVYYCASDYTVGAFGVSCLKSIDGGLVFVRSGQPAFPGIEGQTLQCGWGSGHGVAGPNGTVYLPAGVCGQPMLAISHDEGLTWERVRVADMEMAATQERVDHDAAVAVDSKNNLYYSWAGADLKPYLAVSKDGGKTWSKPVMIAPPGVKIATLIAVDVASAGNLAVSFVGSETQESFGAKYGDHGNYNGYIMKTTEGLSRDPLFYASRINPANDAIDGGCNPGSCAVNREFIDVAIAPDGAVWATFSDGCYDGSCGRTRPFVGITIGRGLAARLVGEPRLR